MSKFKKLHNAPMQQKPGCPWTGGNTHLHDILIYVQICRIRGNI